MEIPNKYTGVDGQTDINQAIRDWRGGDDAAGEVFSQEYHGFVVHQSQEYKSYLEYPGASAVDMGDLVSAGYETALVIASEYYNPDIEGAEFLSYAYSGIRGGIRDEFYRLRGAVTPPVSSIDLMNRFAKAEGVAETTGTSMTDKELAEYIRWEEERPIRATGPAVVKSSHSPHNIRSLRLSMELMRAESLEDVQAQEMTAQKELIAAGIDPPDELPWEWATPLDMPPPPTLDEIVDAAVVRAAVTEAFQPRENETDYARASRERELRVLQLLHGLTDGEPHSFLEVSQELGVTPQATRKIHNRALDKLRHLLLED
ncbi:MAG TPA: sigma factor-like helix-turn-helix DNA-binding protein [Candidatus Saccharimonadales bacterium]|nr:sigma factor-like helix-turn-helix DNA-binding protein [Candidatus Saccharimonadales bacterium]